MTEINRRRNEQLALISARPPELRPGEDEAERMREDFEYWAWRCVRVAHKTTRRRVPFVLNRAQRKVLAEMERQRRAGKPVRVIVLKSRQWGCSTLVCYYMMWMQLMRRPGLNSLVCAHNHSAATTLRGNCSDLVANYPEELGRVEIKRFEGLESVKVLNPGGSRITVCSANNPDAVRGADYAMAHLSEVAYWPATDSRSPAMLVASVAASIMPEPDTVVVMESTANGPGDFFYNAWKGALAGETDMTPVFAGWQDVDYNRADLPEPEADVWARLSEQERALWQKGLTLEQIYWYYQMGRACHGDRSRLVREYPSTPEEAFSNMAQAVFPPDWTERAAANVSDPAGRYEVDLASGALTESPSGRLSVWERPCPPGALKVTHGYIVAVDVGGNWEGADWSVITVVDVREEGAIRVVAEWRGHVDIDHLCQTALALGRMYADALLVVESNSLEQRGGDALERIGASGYPNLYRRRQTEAAGHQMEARIGFHTNASTKPAAINDLAIALRDGLWVERSAAALSEMTTYIRTQRGSTEAAPGCHDDMVMTRAIAAYARRQMPPRPLKVIGEAAWSGRHANPGARR